MARFSVEVDRSVPLRRALVVTAFPTVGNVATVAARFVASFAGLARVGAVHSPDLPPVAAVRGGRPAPPIEVFAGERACGLDGVCESLVVVTSDYRPEDRLAYDLAVALLDWSREVGSGEVVALEGRPAADVDECEVVGVASTERAVGRLREHDVRLLDEGLIGGVSGVLLHRGAAWDVDVYGLVVRAGAGSPDARAAAMLVEVVDRALVRAGIDAGALDGAVAAIEGEVRERQREARREAPALDVAYL